MEALVSRHRNHSMPERHSHAHGWMWPEFPAGIWCSIKSRGLKMFYEGVKKATFKLSWALTMLANIPYSRGLRSAWL